MYKLAMQIGEKIWNCIVVNDYFSRQTLGLQVVRSADSIAANISEGEGVYYFKAKRKFLYYARGSVYETITWLNKMKERKLIKEAAFMDIDEQLEELRRLINGNIKKIPIS